MICQIDAYFSPIILVSNLVIVKPREHNKVKPKIGKIFPTYIPIRHFVMSQKNCLAHL